MTDAESPTEPPHLTPQVMAEEPEQEEEDDGSRVIHEPSKLIRIASMTRAMLDEARHAPLDDAGRRRLAAIYERTNDQLREALSDDHAAELESIFVPLGDDHLTESELRIAQAQLVGWLEGLFHGIQASLWSQQAAATAQLEEMRRRRAFETGDQSGPQPGQYL